MSYRAAEVVRDLTAHPVPTSRRGQGCHAAAQAARRPVQPGPERLQGWGTRSSMGSLTTE